MANIDVTQEFCADPEGFMKRNVVMQWVQRDKPGVISLGVKMIEGAVVDNLPRGKACYIYEKKDAPSLPAYWCPYQQNQFKSAMLGNDALFAFTPAVTGCSVGVGNGESGNQMMCHANEAQIGVDWGETDQAASRQAQSQDAQLRYKLGYDASIASPVDYRVNDSSTMATVFAVHGLNLPWKLKSLNYRKTGQNRFFHAGLCDY